MEAETAFHDTLTVQKKLAEDFPSRPAFRQALANSQHNLGVLYLHTARLVDAETAFRDALEAQKKLAEDYPSRTEFRSALASSHNGMGVLFQVTGRLTEAEAAMRDALALQNQLVNDFPTRREFRHELARSHNNLGRLLHAVRSLAQAEGHLRDGLSLYEQLVTDFPTNSEFRQELAGCHLNLGNLLGSTGRLKDAETPYRDALTIFKQLSEEFSGLADYRNGLAGTLVNLASLGYSRRDFAQARRWLEEAQPHHQAALKANPRHPTYREFYRNNLLVLTKICAGQLDLDGTVLAASKLRDLGWNPPGDAYNAACALALCIPIVEKEDKGSKEERGKQRQFYADQAIAMLRDAVAKGFKDVEHLKKDKDLDTLRDREDFKKLLAELDAGREK